MARNHIAYPGHSLAKCDETSHDSCKSDSTPSISAAGSRCGKLEMQLEALLVLADGDSQVHCADSMQEPFSLSRRPKTMHPLRRRQTVTCFSSLAFFQDTHSKHKYHIADLKP
jgi:hypothetical protein